MADEPVVDAPVDAPAPADWVSQIPADLAGEKLWESVKSKPLPDVLKGYAEAQKMIGGSVRVPGKDAKPEEWDAFHAKLGRPGKPEEYGLRKPETAVPIDDPALSGFQTVAHKAGLTPSQAQSVLDWYGGFINDAVKTVEGDRKAAVETLQNEWGANYEGNLTRAHRAAKEIGGQELIDAFDSAGIGSHPVLLRAFAKLGKMLAEDGVIDSQIEGLEGADDAKGKIASILADKSHAYHKAGPGHKEAVAEMSRLYQLAYPE